VRPDQPVALAGDDEVGLGLCVVADQVGGPEHADDRGVLVGEPLAGHLGAVRKRLVKIKKNIRVDKGKNN